MSNPKILDEALRDALQGKVASSINDWVHRPTEFKIDPDKSAEENLSDLQKLHNNEIGYYYGLVVGLHLVLRAKV